MKIEWADDHMLEARLTIGVLWWKRCAVVSFRADKVGVFNWRYEPSGNIVDAILSDTLLHARHNEAKRRKHATDWQPVSSLPVAKVVRHAK